MLVGLATRRGLFITPHCQLVHPAYLFYFYGILEIKPRTLLTLRQALCNRAKVSAFPTTSWKESKAGEPVGHTHEATSVNSRDLEGQVNYQGKTAGRIEQSRNCTAQILSVMTVTQVQYHLRFSRNKISYLEKKGTISVSTTLKATIKRNYLKVLFIAFNFIF